MPPTAHWGKRPRDDENFVRFSELTAEQKTERRRQERQERKERERTLSYFQSVQRTLDELTRGGGDPTALSSVVDGFFVELMKLLKADPTFHLLRNGTVCRVIEAALSNSMLLHSKSLLYVLLGHLYDLIVSPVASYTLEVLVASMSLSLSGLSDSAEDVEAELTEGGPGMHPGSGVPSAATLLHSMAEELTERMEELIVHEVGSRALRSLILVLGGYSIRNAPMPPDPMKFPNTLGLLSNSIITALEEGYGREYQTGSAAESWMAAAQTPTTSFVLQSLLRVCEAGSKADLAVRQRLENLRFNEEPLLQHLLRDSLGCHIFQAYLKVPTPAAVVAAGDRIALRQQRGKKDQLLRSIGIVDAEEEAADSAWTSERLLGSCCWGKAVQIVQLAIDDLLRPGSELVLQTCYVLQDLALYAPTAVHLQLLWDELLHAKLHDFFTIAALASALTSMVRKCAFEGSSSDDGEAAASIPADINAALRKDEGQGVRYFPVPSDFQKQLCSQLCAGMKALTVKGGAQHLLVDVKMGDKGYDLARYMLHLHPTASIVLQRTMDKLRLEDLLALARHHKGSLVLQQYIKASSYSSAMAGGGSGKVADHNNNNKTQGAASPAASSEGGPALRFLRRVQSHMTDLTHDKYAAYVLETLYDVSSVEVKEALVKALLPVYENLREPVLPDEVPQPVEVEEEAAAEAGAPAPQTAESRRHVARKVMTKCCVEQYIHRRDDWLALAKRQCQVQRLLWRMVLDA